MPSTVNGIGTTYYGKKNVETYAGVCESCGRQVMLQDYETGHYFCIIFIPIIPLGRKQIIGYCPQCTRHRAMPVAEWQRLRENSINDGMAQLAENKDDPNAALELLGTFSAFKQYDQAFKLAAATGSRFRDDLHVQLALGSWYEERGRRAEADRCFDRAYEIDPQDPSSIRARGVGLLAGGQVHEARALLDQLAPPSPHYDPAVFFMLARAYQEQNQHDRAMELFNLIKANSPAWNKDKTFRKAVKKSEKLLR